MVSGGGGCSRHASSVNTYNFTQRSVYFAWHHPSTLWFATLAPVIVTAVLFIWPRLVATTTLIRMYLTTTGGHYNIAQNVATTTLSRMYLTTTGGHYNLVTECIRWPPQHCPECIWPRPVATTTLHRMWPLQHCPECIWPRPVATTTLQQNVFDLLRWPLQHCPECIWPRPVATTTLHRMYLTTTGGRYNISQNVFHHDRWPLQHCTEYIWPRPVATTTLTRMYLTTTGGHYNIASNALLQIDWKMHFTFY